MSDTRTVNSVQARKSLLKAFKVQWLFPIKKIR